VPRVKQWARAHVYTRLPGFFCLIVMSSLSGNMEEMVLALGLRFPPIPRKSSPKIKCSPK
jgi:hypothetical protein